MCSWRGTAVPAPVVAVEFYSRTAGARYRYYCKFRDCPWQQRTHAGELRLAVCRAARGGAAERQHGRGAERQRRHLQCGDKQRRRRGRGHEAWRHARCADVPQRQKVTELPPWRPRATQRHSRRAHGTAPRAARVWAPLGRASGRADFYSARSSMALMGHCGCRNVTGRSWTRPRPPKKQIHFSTFNQESAGRNNFGHLHKRRRGGLEPGSRLTKN